MGTSGRIVVGVASGVTAAVVWALSLAIYQPFMQPTGYWADSATGQSYPNLGSNNTYWPRETRELAILLALAGVILICRAGTRGVLVGVAATSVWLIADLLLDRGDVSGRPAAAWLAVTAVVWFCAVAATATWVSAGRAGSAVVRYLTAVTAAVLGATAMLVTTPWEEPVTAPDQVRVEDAATGMKIALTVMLLVAAIGLVAARLTAAHASRVAILAALAGVATWHAATSDGLPGVLLLCAAASLVVTAAAWDLSVVRLAVVAMTCLLAIGLVGVLVVFAGMAVGGALTSLAGDPPVNSADSDVSLAFVGLALGLVTAALSYLVVRRPVPPVAPASPSAQSA